VNVHKVLDWTILFILVTYVIVAISGDLATVLPGLDLRKELENDGIANEWVWWPPKFMRKAFAEFGKSTDPSLILAPLWITVINSIHLTVLTPVALYLLHGIYFLNRGIRTTAIAFSCVQLQNLVMYLGHLLYGPEDIRSPQPGILLLGTFPYILLPFLLIWRMNTDYYLSGENKTKRI